MFNFFYCFCEVFILKIKIFKSSLPLFFGLYMFEFTSIEWPEYKYNLMLASYSVSSKGIQGKMYLLENCLPPSPKKKNTSQKFPNGLIAQQIGSWKIASQRLALEKLSPLHISPINCLLEDFSLKNCPPI